MEGEAVRLAEAQPEEDDQRKAHADAVHLRPVALILTSESGQGRQPCMLLKKSRYPTCKHVIATAIVFLLKTGILEICAKK